MLIIYSILDFLLLGWLFWLPALVIPIACYYTIEETVRRDRDWPGWPLFWLVLIGAAVCYRYPSVRLSSWHTWVYAALAYGAAGFGVALYKWLDVLVAFRANPATKIKLSTQRASIKLDHPDWNEECVAMEAVAHLRFDGCTVTRDGATITVYPDWRKHPIATHWTYWPFFVVSIPLDWLTHAVKWATGWLKQFWDGIARHFSVRG